MEELSLLNRRGFLRSTAYLAGFGALAASPLAALAKVDQKRIVILHTNDWHSRIEPFPSNDKRFAGQGGAARRASLIKQIRKTESNVLLLDAGDIFQGTPYFNFYGGELEYKLMSAMGYDACTLGNHDFDNGIEGLIKHAQHRRFPILNANYDFSGGPLQTLVETHRIFVKSGIRIGVFGLGIELKGLVPDQLFAGVVYKDPIEAAEKMCKYLREEKQCQLVICLSHLGYSYQGNKVSDLSLAKSAANIDLIIGGHTHTFLPEPVKELNKNGHTVYINQVGWGGLQLGRVDFVFESHDEKGVMQTSHVHKLTNIQNKV